jgi:hypothetical protein
MSGDAVLALLTELERLEELQEVLDELTGAEASERRAELLRAAGVARPVELAAAIAALHRRLDRLESEGAGRP